MQSTYFIKGIEIWYHGNLKSKMNVGCVLLSYYYLFYFYVKRGGMKIGRRQREREICQVVI